MSVAKHRLAFIRAAVHGRLLALLLIWLVSIAAMAVLSPFFLQWQTVPFILQYVSIIGLLGIAQTIVMLAGGPGIDLSVGSVLSLVGIAMSALVKMGVEVHLAAGVGLCFGAFLGLINGILITRIGIPSLIATIATMFAFGGLAVALTGGSPVGGIPESFGWLGQEATLGVPNAFLFVLLPVAASLHIMLTKTVAGRHIVACGNNDHASHLLGINVSVVRTSLYVLNGALAALGSIISMSWFLSARPDAGKGMELLAITIAVLGGSHIFGGVGSIPGTVIAMLIVTTLQVGLQLANISPAWQLGVIGMLLILSMSLNSMKSWRWRRTR